MSTTTAPPEELDHGVDGDQGPGGSEEEPDHVVLDDERADDPDAAVPVDGEPTAASGPPWWHRATAPLRRGSTERVLTVVAVLGVVGTLVFAGLWIGERRSGQGEAAMEARGEEFLLALTNFDAATVDEDFDRIVELGTGDFAAEADQFFGSDVRLALREVQASSRGEVRDLYVQSFAGDRGRLFAVVDQTIANNRFPQPQVDQLRVELVLQRVDGEWRIADVLVLEAPNAAPAAAPAAAVGEDDAADAPDGDEPAPDGAEGG